jgi:hypothetical protein
MAVLAAGALAAVAYGCGNQNPDVTVTHQAAAVANEQSGRQVTASSTATAAVSAQAATLALVVQNGVQLQRMYDSTHSLATPNGVGLGLAQSDLKAVAHRFASLADRARLLPRNDPARPLLVVADAGLRNAASTLEHLVVTSTNRDRILAVTDPVKHLQVHLSRIGRKVATTDRNAIHSDLQILSARVAEAARTG